MKPLITIAVLNLDGLRRLEKTVPSVLSQDYENLEIVYWDNGSTDGSVGWLKRQSKIRVIENEKNDGYGRSKNQLVKAASGDYVLLLDNDIEIISDKFITSIYETYSRIVDIAFASPLVKDVDKDYLTALGLYYNRLQQKVPLSEAEKLGCFAVPAYRGNTVFFRKSIFDELGGFDEIYPFNIDDYDISARAYLMGYRNYTFSNQMAVHHGIEVRHDPVALAWRFKYSFAGYGRVIVKNFSGLHVLYWLPISCCWITIKALRASVRGRTISPFLSHLGSFIIFLRDFPDSWRMRALLQRKRRNRSDIFLKLRPPV